MIAAMLTFPMLVTMACFLGIYGGYLAGWLTGAVTQQEYIYGLQFAFKPNYVLFALIKSVVFGFLVVTIAAFQGFYTKGGAYEVGKASTAAVTNACIAILIADYLLAQLLVG
jgi:phospholipid/cholesterol/gamma-HCH transport system permease protein